VEHDKLDEPEGGEMEWWQIVLLYAVAAVYAFGAAWALGAHL
jgi:hypothetical protein